MLFHTLPFAVFMLVVLPVFFALRKTRLWTVWLLAASYFFYAWWNPYYLLLIAYSTTLDYVLVTLMERCPPARATEAGGGAGSVAPREPSAGNALAGRPGEPHAETAARAVTTAVAHADAAEPGPTPAATRAGGPADPVLRAAFVICAALAAILLIAAVVAGFAAGPAATLRPALAALAALVSLMAAGAWMASRRVWLVISVVNNLALLLFFKYARFAIENVNHLFAALGLTIHVPDPSGLMPYGFAYLLPVGISFFTFQSMSYTIDYYFGRVERERSFLRFATFVCFFPQLMAGPIERARHLLPQFRSTPPFRVENLTDGLSLFLVGLFKKLALANYLSLYVERIYDNPANFGAPALALATFAFAWQIFFDFSGYTDMARGVAKMMGFNLILNFNNPYLATGLGDFWARWHISLSTWFRDYVYIPLGGSRRGTLVTYRNLLIVFLVSGIWHGANWTFAIWGLLHALGVILTRGLERSAFYRERVPRIVKQAWVFAYVCFAWIFFRAASVSDAFLIADRIFRAAWSDPQIPALMLALVGLVWLYEFVYESRLRPLLAMGYVRVSLAVAMMLYLCLCGSGGGTFIYFQF
jgi:alginate O-acetyltransferase complex protein AlgI